MYALKHVRIKDSRIGPSFDSGYKYMSAGKQDLSRRLPVTGSTARFSRG